MFFSLSPVHRRGKFGAWPKHDLPAFVCDCMQAFPVISHDAAQAAQAGQAGQRVLPPRIDFQYFEMGPQYIQRGPRPVGGGDVAVGSLAAIGRTRPEMNSQQACVTLRRMKHGVRLFRFAGHEPLFQFQ